MNHLQGVKTSLQNGLQTGVQIGAAILDTLPKRSLQKGLLLATVGCACFTTIYPFRASASLALRTVALLSSGNNCKEAWNQESTLGRILLCSKIGLLAIGLIAPFQMTALLIADLGLQLLDLGRALHHGNGHKALCHLGAIAINVSVLAALSIGSWNMMLLAVSVNALVMFGFSMMSYKGGDLETFCYISLGAMGMFHVALMPIEMKLREIGAAPKPTLTMQQVPIGGMKIVTKDLH